MYRIGVDVGGTNTDSVLLDLSSKDPVISFFKHPTTLNVTEGIQFAVRKVLKDSAKKLGISEEEVKEKVQSLVIGTTQFINAIVQSDSSRLSKVAVIRLASPYTHEFLPFIDFPAHLEKIMNGHIGIIDGGLQIDGRLIGSISEAQIIDQAIQIKSKGIKDIVVIGIFSPLDVDGTQEYAARDILKRELGPGVNIVCSRDVAHLGILERENASILNASIGRFAQWTVQGFRNAMKSLGLSESGCKLYVTQNDGTLTTASAAAKLPIRTFSSGATNSMRGASFLAGIGKNKDQQNKSILVADVGGTTTDVGVLLPSGYPRQCAAFIKVGGVRTNFSMPDVNSIGLGGGSRVHIDEKTSKVAVGPDSVGHYLTRDALVFGGNTLTATDICVRDGVRDVGDPEAVKDVTEEAVKRAKAAIKKTLENAIDRMKTSPEDCTLLLVGGGSILAPKELEGVGEIISPPYYAVANAVGAAIANVSADVDTIEIMQGKVLSEVLERIKVEAKRKCVEKGAKKDTVEVVEVQVLPVAYVTNQATRIIVRVVGEVGETEGEFVVEDEGVEEAMPGAEQSRVPEHVETIQEKVDYETYRPLIKDDVWYLSETDLYFIMEGCGVLGTGGGGTPYPGFLLGRSVLRKGGKIRIVDHMYLPDDAPLARGGWMGSPNVGMERLEKTQAVVEAGKELAKYMGIGKYQAAICDEIGGGNGMVPLVTSYYYDIPVLDGDFMGRAYPLLNQVLPGMDLRSAFQSALMPAALCDGNGNVVLLTKVKNEHYVENIMRTVTAEMGSSAALVTAPLKLSDARDYGIMRTQSQAWWIGRAIFVCRQKNDLKSIPREILNLQSGACLFVGKIVNVSRVGFIFLPEVRAGFTWGEITISLLRDDETEGSSTASISVGEDDQMIIPFQNENLAAYIQKPDGSRKMTAIVPDLIAVLDSQSGSHLGTQMYAYGLRVTVVALAGSPLWTTEKGLKVGGPTAFGLKDPYTPIGEYRTPKSVIEAFRN
ncbi:Hydantoinase/oxoprolinase [Marasmius fiardii PR-910]|nr:Hydantoinase/oxoprolinase [Marasmius fiardii PR-910]